MAAPSRLPPISSMLAAPANDVPATEEDREAEAKWDGARAVAYGSGGEVILRSLVGQNLTSSSPCGGRQSPALLYRRRGILRAP